MVDIIPSVAVLYERHDNEWSLIQHVCPKKFLEKEYEACQVKKRIGTLTKYVGVTEIRPDLGIQSQAADMVEIESSHLDLATYSL